MNVWTCKCGYKNIGSDTCIKCGKDINGEVKQYTPTQNARSNSTYPKKSDIQIIKVFTLIGSVGSIIDPQTPLGRATAEHISEFAYEQLKQNNPVFALKYNLVSAQNPQHEMRFIMVPNIESMGGAINDFLSGQGLNTLEKVTALATSVFIHGVDSANPITGVKSTYSVVVYFMEKNNIALSLVMAKKSIFNLKFILGGE